MRDIQEARKSQSLNSQIERAAGLFKETKLFIFDMDGTIYLGDCVFPSAVNFIKNLRDCGKKILFFTNNASRNPNTYINKLSKMGFEPQRNELLTSGDVTIRFLQSQRAGRPVYLVGTPDLEEQFRNSGIELNDRSEIVVTSFDTTLTYKKLMTACDLIRNGSEFLSTHPDLNCPTENGFIPDSGAITAFITASTGAVPRYFGKPYADALELICAEYGVTANEICIFGDRLYTDIAFGKRNGAHSILVLTGESTAEDVAELPENLRPDVILPSLSEAGEALLSSY